MLSSFKSPFVIGYLPALEQFGAQSARRSVSHGPWLGFGSYLWSPGKNSIGWSILAITSSFLNLLNASGASPVRWSWRSLKFILLLKLRSASPVVRIREALSLGLKPSKPWLAHLVAPTSRFAKLHSIPPGRQSALGILPATYFLWAHPLKTIHNINGSCFSFDFINHPWCRMLDASISFFVCVCASLYHFGGWSNHNS